MTAPEPAGLAAVVTGGASGTGLATALLPASRGARVACLDLTPDGVPEPLIGIRADVADDEWRHVFDVNVFGIVRTTRAALPHLRRSNHAAIVNTCSTAATAADLVTSGIRVNCVNPGTADTPWIARLLDRADDPEAERAALNARQPRGRLVTADEVAAAIAYLASPLSGATTGTDLAVDGGMSGLRTRPRTPTAASGSPHHTAR